VDEKYAHWQGGSSKSAREKFLGEFQKIDRKWDPFGYFSAIVVRGVALTNAYTYDRDQPSSQGRYACNRSQLASTSTRSWRVAQSCYALPVTAMVLVIAN
jgi:hypothetical protein